MMMMLSLFQRPNNTNTARDLLERERERERQREREREFRIEEVVKVRVPFPEFSFVTSFPTFF